MRRIVLSCQERGGTLRSPVAGSRGEHSRPPPQLLHPSSPSSIPGRAPPVTVACGAGCGARGQRPAGLVGQSRGGLGSRRPGLQRPARSTAALPTPSHGSLHGRPHRAPARRRPRSQSYRPSPADPPRLLAAGDSRPTPAATRALRPALRTRAAGRALRAPLMWTPGGYPDPRPRPGGHPPAAGSPARPPAPDPAGSVSSGFPAHPPGRIPTRASSAHRSSAPGPPWGPVRVPCRSGFDRNPNEYVGVVARFSEAKGRGGDVRAASRPPSAWRGQSQVHGRCPTEPFGLPTLESGSRGRLEPEFAMGNPELFQ